MAKAETVQLRTMSTGCNPLLPFSKSDKFFVILLKKDAFLLMEPTHDYCSAQIERNLQNLQDIVKSFPKLILSITSERIAEIHRN